MQDENQTATNALLYSQAEQIAIDFINSFETLDEFIEKYPEKNFKRATLSVLKSNNGNPMAKPVKEVLSVMGRETEIKRTLIFILYKSADEPYVITYDKAVDIALEAIEQFSTIEAFIKEYPKRKYVKQTIVMLRQKGPTPYPKVVQQILTDQGYTVTINKDHLFVPVEK